MSREIQQQVIQGWQEAQEAAAQAQQERAEQLRSQFEAAWEDGDFDHVGFCFQGQAVAWLGGAGSMCSATVDDEHGLLFSGGTVTGSEGLAAGEGPLWSNAEQLDDLSGGSFCGALGASGEFAGGGVTICASTSDPSIMTVYGGPEVGLGAPGLNYSVGYIGTTIYHEPLRPVEEWWQRVMWSLHNFGSGGHG